MKIIEYDIDTSKMNFSNTDLQKLKIDTAGAGQWSPSDSPLKKFIVLKGSEEEEKDIKNILSKVSALMQEISHDTQKVQDDSHECRNLWTWLKINENTVYVSTATEDWYKKSNVIYVWWYDCLVGVSGEIEEGNYTVKVKETEASTITKGINAIDKNSVIALCIFKKIIAEILSDFCEK